MMFKIVTALVLVALSAGKALPGNDDAVALKVASMTKLERSLVHVEKKMGLSEEEAVKVVLAMEQKDPEFDIDGEALTVAEENLAKFEMEFGEDLSEALDNMKEFPTGLLDGLDIAE